MHAPKTPSRIQTMAAAEAAGPRRPSDVKNSPAKSKEHAARKQVRRNVCNKANRATGEYKLSAMPPANRMASTTAGNLTERVSTALAFRYEMSAGRDRTDASRQFRSARCWRSDQSASFVSPLGRQDLEPVLPGRRTSRQSVVRLGARA